MSVEALREKLRVSGQDHVLDQYADLSSQEQEELLADVSEMISTVDLVHMNRVFKTSMAALEPSSESHEVQPPAREDFFFVTEDSCRASTEHAAHVAKLRLDGLAAIKLGKLAVLVLAGGSGTRLGQTFPKGMLVCSELADHKSLFQLQCEKILRLEKLAGCGETGTVVPFLLMTSPQTDRDTRKFFSDNHFFGLKSDQVHFFAQSSLPCYSKEGKILLQSKCKVATAPGGNGGIYEAIARDGLLDALIAKHVEYVQVLTVDNMLAKVGDPALLGYALEERADVVVKSTPKVRDSEAVGVFAKRSGKWGVVEYTEIGPERASAKDPATHQRLYDCANIAIHLMHVDFLKRASEEMRTYEWYHAALKSISTVAGPVNGVKLEAFIFDIFEFSKRFRIMQVDRSHEFSPIKNSDDGTHTKADTPSTAVRDLHQLHTKWVLSALPSLKQRIDGAKLSFEISPIVSYDGEGLERYLPLVEAEVASKMDSGDHHQHVVCIDSAGAFKKGSSS